MAVLETRTTVQGNSVLYEVVVIDTDSNAEFSDFSFRVTGNMQGLTLEAIEEAVRSLGDSIASVSPTFAVQSIKKISVVEDSLTL